MSAAMAAPSGGNAEHSSRFDRLAPPVLSFVAGYVDICSYLGLFGLFTAQVTGSFVVAGAQIVSSEHGVVTKVLAVPVFFLGAVAVTLLVAFAESRGRSALPFALLLDGALIAGFLALGILGSPIRDPDAPVAVLCGLFGLSAMGAQSALVRLLFKGVAPTNFMTGNTTQVAIDATELVLARLRRAPDDGSAARQLAAARARLANLLALLLGFLAGVSIGATAFVRFGFWSLLLAIVPISAIALWAFMMKLPAAATRSAGT